jgi:hypothetical protein
MNRGHSFYRYGSEVGNRVWEEVPGDAGAAGGGASDTSKVDLEKALGEKETLSREVEDLRAEVLSPEYMEFLANKNKPRVEPKKEDTSPEGGAFGLSKAQIDGMSKVDILKAAAKFADDKAKETQERIRNDFTSSEKEAIKKEVSAFERTHTDYGKYRPVMYGLSTDPKNSDLSLQELYDKAKDHVKSLQEGTTEEEKVKQRKLTGERPGGSNESYEKYKKIYSRASSKGRYG